MIAARDARARRHAASEQIEIARREAEALFANDRLWCTLSSDLMSDTNKLPAKLRAELISLGLWAQRYANTVRFENAPFDPLISLNNQMINGLSASLKAGGAAAALPTSPSAAAPSPSAPVNA
jgi:flagellar protein FlaF